VLLSVTFYWLLQRVGRELEGANAASASICEHHHGWRESLGRGLAKVPVHTGGGPRLSLACVFRVF
jgi:hypothetical protein